MWFLLLYFPKPWSQVLILIYPNWPILIFLRDHHYSLPRGRVWRNLEDPTVFRGEGRGISRCHQGIKRDSRKLTVNWLPSSGRSQEHCRALRVSSIFYRKKTKILRSHPKEINNGQCLCPTSVHGAKEVRSVFESVHFQWQRHTNSKLELEVGDIHALPNARIILQDWLLIKVPLRLFFKLITIVVKVTCPSKVPVAVGVCPFAVGSIISRSSLPPHSIL